MFRICRYCIVLHGLPEDIRLIKRWAEKFAKVHKLKRGSARRRCPHLSTNSPASLSVFFPPDFLESIWIKKDMTEIRSHGCLQHLWRKVMPSWSFRAKSPPAERPEACWAETAAAQDETMNKGRKLKGEMHRDKLYLGWQSRSGGRQEETKMLYKWTG